MYSVRCLLPGSRNVLSSFPQILKIEFPFWACSKFFTIFPFQSSDNLD
jgi:hypothetical protein